MASDNGRGSEKNATKVNEESVDYLLANVDHFINNVYRDLSMNPQEGQSISDASIGARGSAASIYSSSTSRGANTLSRQDSPGVSMPRRFNIDAEVERINSMCETVDNNLRSVGLYLNNFSANIISDDPSSNNFSNAPSSSMSNMIPAVNHTSSSNENSEESGTIPVASAVEHFIDLSNSQTESPFQLRNHNDEPNDDDVILVSANIPSVVDLCTPYRHERYPRSISPEFPRRHFMRRYSAADNSERSTFSQRRMQALASQKSADIAVTASENNSSRTPFMCPVCMDSYVQQQPTSTACGHVFCKQCIERAISLTHKCPMCNRKVTKNRTFRIYI